MALWQSKLGVSFIALKVLFAWEVTLYCLLLYHTIRQHYPLLCLGLAVMVYLECRKLKKDLLLQVGDIEINEQHELIWLNKAWQIRGRPCIFYWGVFVKLSSYQQRTHIWLIQDKLNIADWRALRRYFYWHYSTYRKQLATDYKSREPK